MIPDVIPMITDDFIPMITDDVVKIFIYIDYAASLFTVVSNEIAL